MIGTQRRPQEYLSPMHIAVVLRSVSRLKPHPLNLKVYGDEAPDSILLESVRKNGVVTPIMVAHGGLIISGHRRWLASKKLGIDKIPSILFRGTSLEAEELLIETNRQRVKDKGQVALETSELFRIEQELAVERRNAALTLNGWGRRNGLHEINLQPSDVPREGTSTIFPGANGGEGLAIGTKDGLVTLRNPLNTSELIQPESDGYRPALDTALQAAIGRTRNIVAEKTGQSKNTVEKQVAIVTAATAGNQSAIAALELLKKGKTSLAAAHRMVTMPAEEKELAHDLDSTTPHQQRVAPKSPVPRYVLSLDSLATQIAPALEEFGGTEDELRKITATAHRIADAVESYRGKRAA